MTTERSAERPERRSARTAVVWETLQPFLAAGMLDVLDIGGGTGGFAVKVASLGHRVTVVDPSLDALAALDRRARELSVVVDARQGDLATLDADPASADLVLCHGVLEVVEDPAAALATLHGVLRPGGRLSLLLAQRNAAVIARAMSGHFDQAAALLDDTEPRSRTGRRFTAAEAEQLLAAAGFTVDSVHGIRVFADLIPGSLLDLEPNSTTALIELEHAVAQRAEFLPLATQLHVVARRS